MKTKKRTVRGRTPSVRVDTVSELDRLLYEMSEESYTPESEVIQRDGTLDHYVRQSIRCNY